MDKIKFSKRQLDVIQAAIELLDEKGYNELSLRDIAQKLGVKAPAIYWHFKNKALLIDYIAEYLLQQTLSELKSRTDDETWQDWLRNHILLLRQAMLSCQDGGRIVAGAHLYPTITLAMLMENALVSLRSAGIDMRHSRIIVMATIHYTFGHVIEEQAGSESLELNMPRDPFFFESFPNLFELSDPTVTKETLSDEAEFLAGLQLIIDGADKEN
ncbi:TetR family transcriptional regulator [Lactococcus lactis subsp. lactis]|uniref:TetR family transcriptional regulator n=1 Tax=Lactococcus lactis TaxID=1358 RepID=UPI0021B01C7C|nr:TetR/AcrR family transcriptional regulator C-terminal domain-containing protein [Lactococcus lactis]MCT0016008.1 TetR family transcriptional regulator [Lactococcus lactis subsp. lactis]